jgi:hypothetical protein
VGGRRLPGTDIVLHELWPLAGFRRARAAQAGATLILFLSFFFAFSEDLGVFTASLPVAVLISVLSAWVRWPKLYRVELLGRRVASRMIWFLCVYSSLVLGGFGAFSEELGGAPKGLIVGVVVGFLYGLASSVLYTLVVPGLVGQVYPRTVVRRTLAAGLLLGTVMVFPLGSFILWVRAGFRDNSMNPALFLITGLIMANLFALQFFGNASQ